MTAGPSLSRVWNFRPQLFTHTVLKYLNSSAVHFQGMFETTKPSLGNDDKLFFFLPRIAEMEKVSAKKEVALAKVAVN